MGGKYLWNPFLLLLLFSLTAASAAGQDLPSIHYTTKDGLPSDYAYEAYQDRVGFIWVGTDKGIARFNGLKFETFTTLDGLPDNDVFFFQEDYENRLWFATFNGKLGFYKDGKFYNERNAPFLKVPDNAKHILDIRLEEDSSLTITFRLPRIFANIKHNRLRMYDAESVCSEEPVPYFIDVDKESENRYRMIFEHCIKWVDTNMHVLQRTDLPGRKMMYLFQRKALNGSAIYHFLDSNGKVYSDALKPLFTIDRSIRTGHTIQRFVKDQNNLLLGTDHGLMVNGRLVIKNRTIGGLSQDREGNYWVCVIGDGIYKMGRSLNSYIYKDAYGGAVTFGKPYQHNFFFFTHEKDVYRLDHQYQFKRIFSYQDFTGKLPRYSFDEFTIYRNAIYFKSENELPRNIRIEGIDQPKPSPHYYYNRLPTSWLFFATDSISFLRNGDINTYYVRKPGLRLTGDSAMLYSPADWSAFNKSNFLRVNTGCTWWAPTGRFFGRNDSICMHQLDTDSTMLDKRVAFRPDKNGVIWYSTHRGTYKVVNGKAVYQPQLKNFCFQDFIILDNYLVGYTTNRMQLVCHLEGNNATIDTLDDHSLWDRLVQLNDTSVIIGTNNMYRRLTVDSRSRKSSWKLTILDNPYLPSTSEYFCAVDSLCYFFKNGSITMVPSNELFVNAEGPSVYFDHIRTAQKDRLVDSLVRISYTEARNATITFSVLSLNFRNLVYEYSIAKANQREKIWIPMTGEEISLFKLDYGTYEIKVRARTISGDYSAPDVFYLKVDKPFWARWWFIVLCIILFAFFIYASIRLAIRVTSEKKEREIKFLKSEYRALNALMNPHFIFNALNSIQGLINNNEKIHASEYIRTFSNLVRQNMQNLSRELIPLEKEINLVINYLELEKLRFNDRLNFEVDIDEDVDLSEIMIPPLIIQPLVENSVKHGLWPRDSADNLIVIRVYEKGADLFIEVTDNGVGLHYNTRKKPNHESFGMRNIEERLQKLSLMHNFSITFEINEIRDSKGEVCGTRAFVTIGTRA